MTKTKKTKKTVRTTKRVPKAIREKNAAVVNRVLYSDSWNEEPVYHVNLSFIPSNWEDLDAPLLWLIEEMGKEADKLNTASGTCFMTGTRDFSFEGSKEQMESIMYYFRRSPFKIYGAYGWIDGRGETDLGLGGFSNSKKGVNK
jgi:hypothetical protein